MDPLKAKANYSRVCRLLVDKGSDVLRGTLHARHPPSSLAAVLNANKKALQKIRYSVIKPSQWNLLYPVSGIPDGNNFDITLLTILLRNICGLPSPRTGWNVMPPVSDTSISANIARIKIFRNEVYGHTPRAQYDDTTFESLWQEISKPLIKLGIPQQDIDELKEAPLSPEEESYIDKLNEWKELEDDLLSKLNDVERDVSDVKADVSKIKMIVENVNLSQIDQLAKFDFIGKINSLCKKFHDGTRQWFFEKLSNWFDDEESRVMILTAGPGVGKSVLSAKVCELYKQRGQLAADHFCDFRNSDYKNPHRILQSLASQMCENVSGFRDKLTENLRRKHSQDSLADAFRVLLNDPLHALEIRKRPWYKFWTRAQDRTKLIVVDALDESTTDLKNEFLELISEKFSELPKWIKIFISCRPELPVVKKLQHLNPLEILPDNRHHMLDLELFIRRSLPNLYARNVSSLVSKCEGSFLYAYYLVNELKEIDLGIGPDLSEYVPKGISGFYEKQFKRLKTGLQSFNSETCTSILNSFVNVIAASRAPLPMKTLFACTGVSSEQFQVRETIIGIMSEILPIYEGCLTVYHKSLQDWLILDGYEEHPFVADVADGTERLWRSCKSIYSDINSLRVVSDFQMSAEKRYALENGGKYLLDVGDTDDFHWLVNVWVNVLKLKFYGELDVDFSRIFEIYKSSHSDPILAWITQLHAVLRIISRMYNDDFSNNEAKSYVYLQSLANGCFDVLRNTNNYKNEAKDILDTTKQVWLEEVGNEYDSKFKIVSYAMLSYETEELFQYDPEGVVALSYKTEKRNELECVALSRDNKLLACAEHLEVEVFSLPSLIMIFHLKTCTYSKFLIFSPDTSYILCNSIRTCISIREQKEVPFIPHAPEHIDCCSFSSCGMRLVTFEEHFIKVWDVRTKDLLVKALYFFRFWNCCFSNCNSYILAIPGKPFFPDDEFVIFDSRTLARLNVDDTCTGTCLTYEDHYQMIAPSPRESVEASIRINHIHLPNAETLLIANRYCSEPFKWKNRNCVIFPNSPGAASPLVVYDFITKEIIDVFHINDFSNFRVTNISNLDETNFLICFNPDHIYLLSFETSVESLTVPFVNNADIKCCALSSDDSYIACCYENCILTIKSVDNGKTLQTVELKQPAMACWWSKLHLWVVCKGVVVKYPYDSTHARVLGDCLEECTINFYKVVKFAEGVLVIKYVRFVTDISILKICNEKLCPEQILHDDSFFSAPLSAAISSNGCAVLLYCYRSSDYQLWEIVCENKWELRSSGTLDEIGVVRWLCLTGTKDSRNSLWLSTSGICLHLSSIDLSNDAQRPTLHQLPFLSAATLGVVYLSNSLIICVHDWIHFVKVSDGKILTSLYLGENYCFPWSPPSFFYIASRNLLVLNWNTDIKFFKIRNFDNCLI